jgi:hypothetical protein
MNFALSEFDVIWQQTTAIKNLVWHEKFGV